MTYGSKIVAFYTTLYDANDKFQSAGMQYLLNGTTGILRYSTYSDANRRNRTDYRRVIIDGDKFTEDLFENGSVDKTSTIMHITDGKKSDGRVTSGSYYNENSTDKTTFTVSYDSNGYVSQTKRVLPDGTSTTYTFTWTDGNLTKIESSAGPVATITYSKYDAVVSSFDLNWVIPSLDFLSECTGDAKKLWAVVGKFGKQSANLFTIIKVTDGDVAVGCKLTRRDDTDKGRCYYVQYAKESRKTTLLYSEQWEY
jgi:hypothetical protein